MTGTQSGKQMFAQLIAMRNGVGSRHYERIALADRLLKNHAWVNDSKGGGGDEDKAITRLENEALADICGLVELPQLLEIYHHVPDIKDWRAQNFNLRKIWAAWKSTQPQQVKKSSGGHGTWAPRGLATPAEFAQLTPSRMLNEYKRALSKISHLDNKIHRLEAENSSLSNEVGALRTQSRRKNRIA